MIIKIYSKDNCIYCEKAKDLLKQMNLEYTELKIGEHLTRERFFVENPNAKTVPQIWFDDKLIGGYDALLTQFSD